MDKKSIRKNVLLLRNAADETDIIDKSAIIQDKIINIIDELNIKNVYIYAGYGSEVRTDKIINYCLNNNKRVALPKVIDANNSTMEFYEIYDLYNDVKIGYQGIMEPENNGNKRNDIFLPEIVIMPGVAFDECGNRIGYGKGFYDKFLREKMNDKMVLCALAFDLQVVEAIEADEHDIRMDMLVTESRKIIINNG